MKKIFQYSLVLLTLAMSFVACSDKDDDNYQWASVSGSQVFFAKNLPTQYNLSFDESSFEVPIQRYVADEAITVNLQLTDTTGFYSIPETVSFAAGEKEAKVVVSYDNTVMEYNKFIDATIAIASEGETTPYGNSSYTFSAGAPLTFTSMGKGTYVDNWFAHKDQVEILKCDQVEGVYRVAKPYATYKGDDYFLMTGPMDDWLELTVHKAGDVVGGVELTQDNLVTYPIYSSGAIHPSYPDNDPIWLVHPFSFTDLRAEENYVHNVVMEFQEDGSIGMIQLAPYFYINGLGGWDNTQADGVIEIYFPGFDPKDFSLEVDYVGVLTAAEGGVYAMGSVTPGADIAELRGAVVSADEDPVEVAMAMAAGEQEFYVLEENGYNLPIPEELTGKLQVVIAGFDADGELQAAESVEFEYYGGGANPWKSLGTGLLTDNFVVTMYYSDPETKTTFEPQTYEVEIEENSDNPGLYRIVNAYQHIAEVLDVDYVSTNLEINATDPNGVYISTQSTGLDDGDGVISIASVGGYNLATNEFEDLKTAGLLGTLSDGVITLPAIPSKDGTYSYQGFFFQGSSGYYTGTEGEFKLVLPEAVTSRMQQAAKRSAAKKLAAPAVKKTLKQAKRQKLHIQKLDTRIRL